MKRKKPPVALISVLVLAFLGLAIAGPGFAFYNKSQEEQQTLIHQQEEDRAKAAYAEATKNVKVDSSSEVDKMKKTLSSGKPSVAQQASKSKAEGGRPTQATVPTVIMPDDTVRKPVKNPTTPVGQWYDK